MRAMETSIDPLQMIHDLDSSRKRAILKVQTKTLNVMASELVRKGFEWILPVTLAKSTDPLWPDPWCKYREEDRVRYLRRKSQDDAKHDRSEACSRFSRS